MIGSWERRTTFEYIRCSGILGMCLWVLHDCVMDSRVYAEISSILLVVSS